LNRRYNTILKKIKNFDNLINRFEYKRLAFDLFEEWEDSKVQVIEELGIIKGFITEICEEKKTEFIYNLKEEIKVLTNRINVLKAEFDYIKELNLDFSSSEFDYNQIEDGKFAYITQIRKKLFKLDGEIRELLINNVEFNDIFKDILRIWVSTKIEIQEYLNELDRQLKTMKDTLIEYLLQSGARIHENGINGVDSELGFQLLQSQIQSIITERIEGIKKFNDNFSNLSSKLEFLIKKKEFSDAKKLMDMNSTQIQNYIEEVEKQIENIIGKEKIMEDNNIFNLYVRPYINKFNASKELLINKLKTFIRKSENKLYLNQIKYYLNIINPIKLNLLSSYVNLDIERLKDQILKFINKNKLAAKIINDKLYFQQIESDIIGSKEILFFKNIKTIGNEIYLNFKLTNPSNFGFKDLQISLKVPSYVSLKRKESFPKFLQLNELKPGKVFKFNYVLKVNKQKELRKNLFDPTADEIKLDFYYKTGPFNLAKKTTKHIDLFIS